jgi:hypothetical protein
MTPSYAAPAPAQPRTTPETPETTAAHRRSLRASNPEDQPPVIRTRPAAIALILFAGPVVAQTGGTCGLFVAVEPGDTFDAIAARCGLDARALRDANPDVAALPIGTTLRTGPEPATGTTPLDVLPGLDPADIADTGAVPPANALAPGIYNTTFAGTWVIAGGKCDRPSDTYRLGAATVVARGVQCVIGDIGGSDEGVTLQLGCDTPGTATGEATGEARALTLSQDDGRLVLGGADLDAPLDRCTP